MDMTLKKELASILGSEYVSDDPDTLERYSKDYSFVQQRRPSCVAYPQNRDEVQAIVKYANKRLTAVIPRSSQVSFYGAGIPSQGGIIVDLTRMNKILNVDAQDRKVRVEPGVTWAQLQERLEKQGMMVCNPLLPHPLKSVLTSTMEREPILIPKCEYSEVFLTGEMVLASGELFYLGTAIAMGMKGRCNPWGLIPSTKIFTGTQGTLGIITWATLKAEFIPKMDKVFFIPFDRIENLAEPIYRIQRRMLGNECFVLNSLNLATILAENGVAQFDDLRESLPPWTLILCLSAYRLPEEKLEYEEEALMEIASEFNFDVLPTVAGISGLRDTLVKLLRKPWSKDRYWKFCYKDSCHDIFFYAALSRMPELTKAIEAVAVRYGYPTRDIGFYLQPIDRARIGYYQYSFPCDSHDAKEVERVRSLYLEISELVISMGGFFATPYGAWADMVYRRANNYVEVLKVLKNVFDPNNIMNPGKLCF
jgi:FAD/FMN-containing dehydrogenase